MYGGGKVIDEALAALRRWRDNRDREEARDLKKRERWLWRNIEAAYAARDEYERAHAIMEQEAHDRALTAAGITVGEWMPGWKQYRKNGKLIDAWSLTGVLAPYYEAPEHNPPFGPDVEILHEHSITVGMIAGLTREQAEEAWTNEEARKEAIRLRCETPGPGLRTVDAGIDPRRPMMVSQREYNRLVGIPGRDEIAALGPAQLED